ncbi:MAG: tetratricopeptide repeat protein [Acidobacteriota bacterium]
MIIECPPLKGDVALGKASARKKQKTIQKALDRTASPEIRTDSFPWWLLAILCVVAFLAFARTISYDFVYDDDMQVLRNPWIRDWSQVGKFFFADVWRFRNNQPGNYYRPLHMLAHATGYAISGLKPYGFHLINVLLHCFSTLLVALFGYRLTREKAASAVGALIFAVHPVHAESVSWIAGVTDLLCAVFYFGVLYVWLDQERSKNGKIALLGALLFLGALFSKEMAFMLPFAVVWLDLCVGRKLRWDRYAALLISFGIYAGFRTHALSQFQISQTSIQIGFIDRVLSSIVLLGEYIAKAFVPFNINAFHVFHPTVSAGDPRFFLSILVILAFALMALIFQSDKKILFLAGFIPLSLLPVLNITGIGENVFADRYLYIPSLGSCLLIPLLAQKAAAIKQLQFRIPGKRVSIGLAGGVCGIYAFVLYNTAFMWRDNRTLYTETMKRSPDSALIASNLSDTYYRAGLMKDAEFWAGRSEENWKKAYIRTPGLLVANYVRLSSIYVQERKFQEALKFLKKGYEIDPSSPELLQNLAGVYIMMGNYADARRACEASLAIDSKNELVHNNLAFILLHDKEEVDAAIEHARKAIEIFPQYADAYLNLARGYAAKGLAAQSIEAYRHAVLINPTLKPVVDQELQQNGVRP